MAKVLIVEDELSIQKLLKYDVEKSGFDVEVASDGEEALNKVLNEYFDIILLDLMLPKKSGLEVCQEIRSKGITSYVIMLTAMDSEWNKIEGLDVGADDYITKPFSPREVIARINSGVRRVTMDSSMESDDLLTYRDITINHSKFEAYMDQTKIDLTLKEMELLIYLIKHKGKALSRDRLLNKLWGFSYDGDTRIVDVHIFKLREKIDPHNRMIKTIRGVGYMLEGE